MSIISRDPSVSKSTWLQVGIFRLVSLHSLEVHSLNCSGMVCDFPGVLSLNRQFLETQPGHLYLAVTSSLPFRGKLQFPLALSSGCCNPFSCLILPWLHVTTSGSTATFTVLPLVTSVCLQELDVFLGFVFPQLVPSS